MNEQRSSRDSLKIDLAERFRETLRPLGEFFNRLIRLPAEASGSFLWLDPHDSSIQFFGVSANRRFDSAQMDRAGSAAEFARRVDEVVAALPLRGPQDLFKAVRSVAFSDAAYSPTEAYQGAVNRLELEPFTPGNSYDAGERCLIPIQHWSLWQDRAPGLRPLTHFQDALDLAAIYRFDSEALRAGRPGSRFQRLASWPGTKTILVKVDNYAERSGLLSFNASLYVAEYFQVYQPGRGEQAAPEREPVAVDEYFMPMRGFGQWRAALEYKVLRRTGEDPSAGSRRNDDTPSKRIERELVEVNILAVRLALEELFTRALINTFAHLLLDARSEEGRHLAFASIWWARALRFGRAAAPKGVTWGPRKGWCPDRRTLISVAGAEREDPSSKELEFGHTHHCWLTIEKGGSASLCRRVVLFLGRLDEKDEQRRWFAEEWGFDTVELHCNLVDVGDEDSSPKANDFDRWADVLGDELVQVRSSLFQAARAKEAEIRSASAEAEYSTALFTFGHHVGKLFQESGLAGLSASAYGLDPASPAALRLSRMKSRLMLAWGVGEMTRPLRHGGKGFPARWFPREIRRVGAKALARTLLKLCQYYLSSLIHNLPGDWTLEWSVDGERPAVDTIADLVGRRDLGLPGLPPFAGGPSASQATAAVTIGLAEQLRNLRQSWLDDRDDLLRGFRQRQFERLARCRARVDTAAMTCQVEIEGISFYREQEDVGADHRLRSWSIGEIQHLERKALSIDNVPVVETGQPRYLEDAGRYRRVGTLWIYHYGLVRQAPEEN